MQELPSFTPFPKIPRLFQKITITEKIDGTNASVWIDPVERCFTEGHDTLNLSLNPETSKQVLGIVDGHIIRAASRKRFLTLLDDNYGFARWVGDNAQALYRTLGPGHHFGEWWGKGIQRSYNLQERRFSLFNVDRWGEADLGGLCYTVPVLDRRDCVSAYDLTDSIGSASTELYMYGSISAPGFDRPEGIVIRFENGSLFKFTFDGDGHKGAR